MYNVITDVWVETCNRENNKLETLHILFTDRYHGQSTSTPTKYSFTIPETLLFLASQWWLYYMTLSSQIISGSAEMSFCKHDNINRILRLIGRIDIFTLTNIVAKLISHRVHFQFSLFVLIYAMKAPLKPSFFVKKNIGNEIK